MSRKLTRTVAAILFAAVAGAPAVAHAGVGGGGGQGGGGSSEDGVITATVVHETDGSSSGGSESDCTWTAANGTLGVGSMGSVTWPLTIDGVTYNLWRKDCSDGSTWYQLPERQPEDLLPELLTQLRQQALPAPVPVFEKLDAQFGWAYVQTPVDFRAGEAWRTVSVTASLGPLWARVTATPQRLTFDPGDPAGPGPVTCEGDGPLAPYVPETPGACSYTYRNASSTSSLDGYHFPTQLTIEWSTSWTSSTGAGGALEPYSTSSSALLAVAEVKGLVTCTGPRAEQGGC